VVKPKPNRKTTYRSDESLIPQKALKEVEKRFRSPVKSGKYEAWDWLTAYSQQDIMAKIDRHWTKEKNGLREDEDGTHLAAVVADALMLLEYRLRGIGTDPADEPGPDITCLFTDLEPIARKTPDRK